MQPGYVLHRRRYGDSSLLLDVFTRSCGRLSVIARGVLKGKRARGGELQPFVPLLLEWRGRGEVATLRAAEGAGLPLALTGLRLYCGIYVNELLTRLVPRHDPHPALFTDYAATLATLVEGEIDPVLRRFELGLLRELGLGIPLDCDRDGTPLAAEAHYIVDPEQGAVPATSRTSRALSGATLLALHGETLEPRQYREARLLLRRVLQHHIGDRPLKSRELLAGLYGGD